MDYVRGRGHQASCLARPESQSRVPGSLSLCIDPDTALSLISHHHLSGTIRHRTRPPLDTPPPWSRHYLDPAIRGLFPLINKTLRVTPRVRDYLHKHASLPVSRPHPGPDIMSLFIVTNVRDIWARVRNAAPCLSLLDAAPS